MSGSATAPSSGASLSVSSRPVGAVGGEGFAVDASLIAADANKQRALMIRMFLVGYVFAIRSER